jgi:peptide/nickel transport system permease protein
VLFFVLRRFAAGLVLVVVVATLAFLAMRLTASNPAVAIIGESATQPQIDKLTHQLGLDQSWLQQYWNWLSGVLRFDFGASWYSNTPVLEDRSIRLPGTMGFVVMGLLISATFALLLGVLAAVRGGVVDRMVQILGIIGFGVPAYLIAMFLAIQLAINRSVFPATGIVLWSESPAGYLHHLTLPAVALAVGAMASTAQQVRGAMIDQLDADYVRTLRSRGITERQIIFKHALRNGAPAALTNLGIQFIAMLGGGVVIESIFNLPGIGSMATIGAQRGDQPVVLGVVVIMVFAVVIVNTLIDIAYGLLNPKVRVK